jgi:formylglycine-generating enzyme required for sulfatase activity
MQRQPPEGMVEIPAGVLQMGDPSEEGDGDERPRHSVEVGAFFLAKHQVTLSLWREIVDWAERNGYQFENQGSGFGDDHPVHTVSWYDVVKWCNAYSERQGRRAAYFENQIGGKVYRQGTVDLSSSAVDWNGEGFRLPTEAEWEKAARGGLVGHHYPWPSEGAGYEKFISPEMANYDASGKRKTTPVASYDPNGFGLYDMAGNVWEWCWDRWHSGWYATSGATDPNTRGPDSGVSRVYRGGCWRYSAWSLRCSVRGYWGPSLTFDFLGFRLAGGQVQVAELDEGGERGLRDEAPGVPPEESGAAAEEHGVLEKVKDLFRRRRK